MAKSTSTLKKLASQKRVQLIIVIAAASLTYAFFGQWLSLESLAARESELRAFQSRHPLLVFGLAFLIYVTITGASLPGAAALTLVYGWYFGLWQGLLLVSFASTAGATVAFLVSRYMFRNAIEKRFGERLKAFDSSLEREGPFYLFTLRLIPAVPFFIVNAVMGLTSIKTKTFWWISQVGMLAGTFVFVYAGATVPDLNTLANDGINAVFSPLQMTQIIAAFALLGLFPLAVRYASKFFTQAATVTSA